MSRNLDAAVDVIDRALYAAAHDRLKRALENAVQMVNELGEDEATYGLPRLEAQQVTGVLAELDVAKHAADAIRQADA